MVIVAGAKKFILARAKAYNQRVQTARIQRDSDMAVIRKMEDEQAPIYAKIMDEEYKAEGKYDAIGWDPMSVRFPSVTPAFLKIVSHLDSHGWLPDGSGDGTFSPRGYMFKYYYKFPKTDELPSQTMECAIHGHVGMPLAHQCLVNW